MRKATILFLVALILPVFVYAGPIQDMHRAVIAARRAGGGGPPPTCTTEYATCAPADSTYYAIGDSSTRIAQASLFTTGAATTICKMSIKVNRVGSSGSTTFTGYIYTDTGSGPGSQVGTGSGPVPISAASSGGGFVTFENMSATLSASTNYYMVIWASGVDASNYWRAISTANCSPEIIYRYNGSAWELSYSGRAFQYYLYE